MQKRRNHMVCFPLGTSVALMVLVILSIPISPGLWSDTGCKWARLRLILVAAGTRGTLAGAEMQ